MRGLTSTTPNPLMHAYNPTLQQAGSTQPSIALSTTNEIVGLSRYKTGWNIARPPTFGKHTQRFQNTSVSALTNSFRC